MISLNLPYPPSVNHYWRHTNRGVFLRKAGQDYRQAVWAILAESGHPTLLDARLKVEVAVFPPDRRKRDLDNCLKALLDALEAAKLFADDEQIDHLEVRRCDTIEDGAVWVRLTPIRGAVTA